MHRHHLSDEQGMVPIAAMVHNTALVAGIGV
jgi:hypothetical protein